MKVILSSPKDTPKDDLLFVIEESTVSRIKMRLIDVEREIVRIDKDAINKAKRKVYLEGVKKDMNKLIK